MVRLLPLHQQIFRGHRNRVREIIHLPPHQVDHVRRHLVQVAVETIPLCQLMVVALELRVPLALRFAPDNLAVHAQDLVNVQDQYPAVARTHLAMVEPLVAAEIMLAPPDEVALVDLVAEQGEAGWRWRTWWLRWTRSRSGRSGPNSRRFWSWR